MSGNITAMPRVLGIDTSLTATGLARVDFTPDGSVIQVATVGAPGPSKTDKSRRAMSRRVSALMSQIEGAIIDADDIENGYKPDLIVMESLAFDAGRGSAYALAWVWCRTIDLAEHYDIPLIFAGTSQVKKYATGKGNADKDTVVLAVAKRWPDAEVTNNNEADAVVLAAIGCRYLGYPIDDVPKVNQEIMEKVGP